MDDRPARDNIDAIYYRDAVNGSFSRSFAVSLLERARRRMLGLFMRRLRPGPSTTILDIGVSDDDTEGANFLEAHYPWPGQITCTGLGTGEGIRARHPGIAFVRTLPGQPLPFPDQSFDIACSNAVLEHVGGGAQRRTFLAEHLRVARAVFVTVPNRWFFVEHHTGLPLLHYSPALFRRLLAGTRLDHWAHPANLEFIGRAALRRAWPLAAPPALVMTGLPCGPFSSNVALIFGADGASRPETG